MWRSYLLALCLIVAAPADAAAQRRNAARTRVACVGDSLTYGKGLRERARQAYPAVLGRLLGSNYEVKNFGVNGCTALRQSNKPYWEQRALNRASEFNPQVVVVMLGSNDSKPACWDPPAFRRDLTALAERFQHLPTRPRVLLCTPTPVFRDRWGVRGSTLDREVIPQILHVAASKRLQVVDMHTLLRDTPQRFPDGIHPDGQAAEQMARAVQRALAGRR
jgi:lysophospholipase L1-like esterase